MKPSATIPLLHAEMERLRSDRSLLAGNQGMGGDESALDRWIVGPSAVGSEKGTPSSITSAPASTIASTRASVVSRSGSPAVRKGTSAFSPFARSFSK